MSRRTGQQVAQARELVKERGWDKLMIVQSKKVDKGRSKVGERGWVKGDSVLKVGKAKGRQCEDLRMLVMNTGKTEQMYELMGAGETCPIMPAQWAALIQDKGEELAKCKEAAELKDSGVKIKNKDAAGSRAAS